MAVLDRQQLEAFAAVIEHQSFERASAALNLTRGAVSQRIKALEQALSTMLVIRERPIRPTQPGKVLFKHVSTLRLLEHEVFESIPNYAKRPQKLAIGIDTDSLTTWFEPVLLDLMNDHSLSLEVIVENQEHTMDLLAGGEAYGCVSTTSQPLDGFEAFALGALEYRCVATPKFSARHFSSGLTASTLLSAHAILHNRKALQHNIFLGQLLGITFERYPRHYAPSPQTIMQAVLAGSGYALIPAMQADPLLATRALVDLAPRQTHRVPLFWHQRATRLPVVERFTQRIVAGARKALCAPSVATAARAENVR